MFLLPKPSKLEIKDGYLKTKKVNIINLCDDVRIEKALRFFDSGDGIDLTIKCDSKTSEGYALTISESGILIKGDSAAGAFYGIQTLRQIFENNDVPYLIIEDKPDMKHRGFYHDVTRGKIPTVDRMKKLIDTLAYYKMNSLQIYVEHTFPFKELGDLIEKTGYLSPDEIMELDDYCYDNFIEFIPSIATFGHIYELLQRDEYQELQCAENFDNDRVFWHNRMAHHTIDPTNEKSIEIIKSLIDQYIPLFRSDKFNICCDVTFDLKNGKHKDKNTAKLYIDFVKQIIAHLESKGKTVMMWGDILLQHPETITELPKDTIFLNWAYHANPSEESFKTFSDLGCRMIPCPGTTTWSRLVECVEIADQNITKMCDFGYKYGAYGMLNTNWGDFGNPCSIELAMHGLVLGAAKSWNKATTPDDEFNSAMCKLEYKNCNAVRYLVKLDSAHKHINWNILAHIYSNLVYGDKFEIRYPEKEDIEKSISDCADLINKLSAQTWERDKYRTELLLAAEGVLVMAELYAKFIKLNINRLSDTQLWLSKYRKEWLKYNKESELCEIEKFFTHLENA